jgi:hypothetical protein
VTAVEYCYSFLLTKNLSCYFIFTLTTTKNIYEILVSKKKEKQKSIDDLEFLIVVVIVIIGESQRHTKKREILKQTNAKLIRNLNDSTLKIKMQQQQQR